MDHNRNTGFTTIELIIVVVIVGILFAIALPKFNTMQSNAQVAAVQKLLGAFRSSVNIAHATWIANGASNAVGGTVITLEGQNTHLNQYGWPDSNVTNGATGMGVTSGCGGCLNLLTNLFGAHVTAYCGFNSCNNAQKPCYFADWSGNVTNVCTYKLFISGLSLQNTGQEPTINYNLSTGKVSSCTSNCVNVYS